MFKTGLLLACLLSVTTATLAWADPPQVSHNTLRTFQAPDGSELTDPEPIPGSLSVLVRKKKKIELELLTFDLPPGVYTFWWHLNNQGTGVEDDSILWATSTIVGEDGIAHVTAKLKEGKNPGFVFTGNGLLSAQHAHVEVFVRWHGAPSPDPDQLELQLSHPFAGCIHELNPYPHEDDVICYNPQIAVHPADAGADDD